MPAVFYFLGNKKWMKALNKINMLDNCRLGLHGADGAVSISSLVSSLQDLGQALTSSSLCFLMLKDGADLDD